MGVGNKWLPEIRHHCPNSPFLLVGTKSDLRKDARALEKLKAKGASLVDLARAEEKGQELAAARVMECSAKTQVGLKDVFDEAIKVALAARAKPAKKKGGCCCCKYNVLPEINPLNNGLFHFCVLLARKTRKPRLKNACRLFFSTSPSGV